MHLGPVMLDIAGLELTAEDREVLQHPGVGGVILFQRNYHSPAQLSELSMQIKQLRQPGLLIAVDQEGGRVQRFGTEYSRLPALRKLGLVFDRDPQTAFALAESLGWVLASELRACGVDISFAPVLDLYQDDKGVIGDRALHADPLIVTQLAAVIIGGMAYAGMSAVAKHFPGHGGVSVDSHVALPCKHATLAELQNTDLRPFKALLEKKIHAVMTAHLLIPQVDDVPVTLSTQWLSSLLRDAWGFNGMIFSDDLSMGALHPYGDMVARTHSALQAGCDMVLICNDRAAAGAVLTALPALQQMPVTRRAEMLKPNHASLSFTELLQSASWLKHVTRLRDLTDS